jgi:DcmR-like sensory protein
VARRSSGNHSVQLFDSDESRAESVADFISEGVSAGETVLVVLTAANWCGIARQLVDNGFALQNAIGSGQLTVVDATTALGRILVGGSPDSARFEQVLGCLVRKLQRRNGTLRVYGEVVDLLAGDRDFVGAQQLEALWNHLLAVCPFTLFCGYSAVNFGDPRSALALRRICQCHSDVRTVEQDDLGAWLVKTATADASHPLTA